MKKTLKALLMVFAVAFGVLVFNGADAKAAVDPVKQTGVDTTSVAISWAAELGADGYNIYFSYDGVNWTYMDYAYGTEAGISGLSVDSLYYVKVAAVKDDVEISQSSPVAVSTAPELEDVTGLTQSGATTTSVTLKWDKMPGVVSYDVYWHDGNNSVKIGNTVNNYFTKTKLVASSEYRFAVVPRKVTKTGISIVGYTPYYSYLDFTGGFRTVPGKVLNTQITSLYDSINVAYYGWNGVANCDGYQFQLLNYKGKKLVNTHTSGASIRLDPYYKGTVTKARVRAYITVAGKKIYGAWSGYDYNALSKGVTITSKNKKINLKWKTIKGVKNYTVYISKTENGGYKKVKKLGAKKKSLTITKCGKQKLKRSTRYYIKIEYTIQKKVKSRIVSKGSIYVY